MSNDKTVEVTLTILSPPEGFKVVEGLHSREDGEMFFSNYEGWIESNSVCRGRFIIARPVSTWDVPDWLPDGELYFSDQEWWWNNREFAPRCFCISGGIVEVFGREFTPPKEEGKYTIESGTVVAFEPEAEEPAEPRTT